MSRMARHYELSNSKQPCEVCGLTDGNVLRGVFPNALPTDSYYGVVTFVHDEGECYQAMRNEITRLRALVRELAEVLASFGAYGNLYAMLGLHLSHKDGCPAITLEDTRCTCYLLAQLRRLKEFDQKRDDALRQLKEDGDANR